MITSTESLGKLFTALHAAKGQMRPVAKSGFNSFHRYKYANALDWWDAVTPALQANGLILITSTHNVETEPERKSRKGNAEFNVKVFGNARLCHTSGEWIQTCCVGDGQDDADKATYKAITGMKKYVYACMFDLPTTDDPEADESVGKEPEPEPKRSPQPPTSKRIEDGIRAIGAAEDMVTVKKYQTAIMGFDGITESQIARLQQAVTARGIALSSKE